MAIKYVRTFGKKEAIIPEKHYLNMLERFHPDGRKRKDVGCTLCKEHFENRCKGCPLNKFKFKSSIESGCVQLIIQLIGEELTGAIEFVRESRVTLYQQKKGKEALKLIQEELKKFKDAKR